MKLLYLPFIIQGVIMFVDEFYFHENRGLPRWESIGHPLDTLTVLGCYSYLIWGEVNLSVYLLLCGFSCLFITKDEFVHREQCTPAEQWLHSLLFILHPLSFVAGYFLWEAGEMTVLKIQFTVVTLFLFYQTLRWRSKWQTQA